MKKNNKHVMHLVFRVADMLVRNILPHLSQLHHCYAVHQTVAEPVAHCVGFDGELKGW